MRRTLTYCRNGLAVAAAAVLLTACGDDGGSEPASESEATSASESSPSDGGNEEFCQAAVDVQGRVSSTLGEQSDPATLPQVLQQVAAEIRAIDAPDEIADDWQALAGGVEQIASAFASTDFNNPEAAAAFQEQIAQLQTDLADATTNVQEYLSEECGIEIEPSDTAAPSS
jgi:hypothetical protein